VTGLYNDPASGQIIPIETATAIFVRRGANSPAAERAQERRLARRDPVEAVTEALQRRAARLGLTWRTGAAASETGPGATANTRISRRDAVRERVSERRTDISSRRAGLHRDAVEQAASRAEAVRGRIAQARARVPEARPSVRVDTTPRVSRPVTRLHAMHEADLHDLAVSHLSV
jgi:hypothetical protein